MGMDPSTSWEHALSRNSCLDSTMNWKKGRRTSVDM
jgi:hypothetical protein